MADVFDGPLTASDPWAHIRAHAVQGGLYASAIEQLLNRVQALEARSEVQVLPTTPQEGGPTLLVPIQLHQGAEPAGGLVDGVTDAIVDGMVAGERAAAYAAILAVADALEASAQGSCARWLRNEVCLAASLQALAGHKPPPWTGEGPLCHWHPSQKTRQELRNIADELEGCADE